MRAAYARPVEVGRGCRLDSSAKNRCAPVVPLAAGRQPKPLRLLQIATMKEFFAKAN